MATLLKAPEKSEIKVENILNRIPGLVAVYNINSGEYAFVNEAVENILGYSPSDFLDGGAEFVSSLVHPDDIGLIMEKNQTALARADKAHPPIASNREPVVSFEYRMRHTDGRWIWLHTEGSVYDRTSDGRVSHVLNVSINITERKKTEQKLSTHTQELKSKIEQHAERLHLALEASKMGTWEWNIETGDLIWSPEMMRLYGLDPEKDIISYEKFFGALHPDHREEKKVVLTNAVETGKPYQIEHRCVWPDGSVHWILGQGKAYMKNGKSYRMVGTAMNIDERKATEAALKASQIKYKTLFESNVIGIFITDQHGKIVEANDKFVALMGYSRKDMERGKVLCDSLTPSEYKQIDREKTKELRANKEITPWEKEYIRKDGSRVPVLLGEVMIPNSDMLTITIVIDITEREQLAKLNKSKDEFISLASHQLRTPATAVKQYMGMLMEEYFGELNDKQLFMLQTAYESNERQLTIIDDLLRVARLDAGEVRLHKEKTNVRELLDSIVREQYIRFKARKQRVSVETEDKLLATLDKPRMHMVLGNLLDNAGKYTPQGKQIKLRASRKGQNIQIEIEDEGVGIDKKDFDKLFHKFSRVDNPLSTIVGGSGLGLYWSKRIIDLHDGIIEVKSKINHGTIFTINLPANKN